MTLESQLNDLGRWFADRGVTLKAQYEGAWVVELTCPALGTRHAVSESLGTAVIVAARIVEVGLQQIGEATNNNQ